MSEIDKQTMFLQMRRLISDQGRKHWKGYAAAFCFMALIGAMTSLTAYLMKDVVNKVFVDKQATSIFILAAAVIAIYTTKGLSTYGQQVTLSRISNSIVADIQKRLFDHMLMLGVNIFDDRHSSDFIARQWFIVSSAGRALNIIVTAISRDFIMLVGLLIVMIIQDPIMSIFGLIVFPIAIFSMRSLVKRSRKVITQEFGGAALALETIQETAKGIRTVKSFQLEDTQRSRMRNAIESFERAGNKLSMVGARTAPITEALGGFAVAGVIVYGGYRVVEAGQSPGEFFSFITALLLAYEPAKRLARVHMELSAALVGVEMLYQFLDIPQSDKDPDNASSLLVTAGKIQLDGVWFEYRPDEPVIQDLSFVAEAGQVTALVGASGGGKSTIISLLQRFYEPTAGRILIDEQDIALVSRKSLRSRLAVVNQDVFLFKGTIRDNIAFGRPEASNDEIIDAAKAALAHEFIMKFQQGYDSQVGEDGHQLSGGQKQRIAIARAILKGAQILLLDEATSALDVESEQSVQIALNNLRGTTTVIIIAHRLQTVQRSDKIIVIERGQVIEEGTHAELMSRPGRYREFKALLS